MGGSIRSVSLGGIVRRRTGSTLLVMLLPLAAASATPGTGEEWERLGTKDGITSYRREVPGSPVVAIKGDGIVEASILRVASVILDTGRLQEWTDSLASARRIRIVSWMEFVEYDHIRTPFILKDRDFVVHTRVELEPARRQIVLQMRSVSDPAAPVTSRVRGELLQSTYVLTGLDHGRRTRMVADVHADPKGSVPKWIVNHYQQGWAHDTIRRLRAQVARPDVSDDPELGRILAEQGYFD
jgi:hypothetical protein